jgi:KDO2-lipid IV(A) lauroyltransferase
MSRDVLQRLPKFRRFVFRLKLLLAQYLPVPVGRLIAYTVGHFLWLFDARGRKIVARNQAHFIPGTLHEALRRSVRRNYVCFAIYIYESFRMDRLPAWYFKSPHLTVSDPFAVFAKKPLSGPAIILTVHSNWELISMVLYRLGMVTHMDAVALSSGDPAIDHIFHRLRKSANADSLDLKYAPLGTLRSLKAGRIVGIVGDRDYTGNGLRIPFAGQLMSLPLGPAALAVQAQATIVPVYLARRGLTRLHLQIGRPLVADPSQAKAAEVDRLMSVLSATMSRFLATAPSQWIAFHDAWAESSETRVTNDTF